jgi:hypothetical protein
MNLVLEAIQEIRVEIKYIHKDHGRKGVQDLFQYCLGQTANRVSQLVGIGQKVILTYLIHQHGTRGRSH